MGIHIRFGGGRHHHRVSRRVPRNRRHYPYRGGGVTVSSSKGKFFIGLIFVALALLIGYITYNNTNKTSDYVQVDGYVVDYYERWDSSDGQYLYSEIIEYTVDGKIYECTSSSSSNMPLPYNSRVTVYYNPVNPSVAVVNQKSNNVFAYVICGIFGLAGLAVMFSGIKNFFVGKQEEE